MIHTKSRANLLALILVILFFVILSFYSRILRDKLAILLSGTFLIVVIFRERIIYEFGTLIAAFQALPTQIANPTGSIGIRVNLIRNGAHFLIVTRGFGVAAGNFESWMRARAIYPTQNIVNAHGWFLEVIANYGIFIFVGYLVFYLGLIGQIYHVLLTHWNDQKMKIVGVALMGAMFAFSIASTSSSSMIAFRPQWLMFALGLAYVRIGLNIDQMQTDMSG
jgi:teichuronic acid biosynthesis protein TuaE